MASQATFASYAREMVCPVTLVEGGRTTLADSLVMFAAAALSRRRDALA